MKWNLTSEVDPVDSQVCICNRKHDGNVSVWYEIELLTWDDHYKCWNDRYNDDYECEKHQVTHWMPIPECPIK